MGTKLLRQKKTWRTIFIANKISAGIVLCAVRKFSFSSHFHDSHILLLPPLQALNTWCVRQHLRKAALKVLQASNSPVYFTGVINADEAFPGITRPVHGFVIPKLPHITDSWQRELTKEEQAQSQVICCSALKNSFPTQSQRFRTRRIKGEIGIKKCRWRRKQVEKEDGLGDGCVWKWWGKICCSKEKNLQMYEVGNISKAQRSVDGFLLAIQSKNIHQYILSY